MKKKLCNMNGWNSSPNFGSRECVGTRWKCSFSVDGGGWSMRDLVLGRHQSEFWSSKGYHFFLLLPSLPLFLPSSFSPSRSRSSFASTALEFSLSRWVRCSRDFFLAFSLPSSIHPSVALFLSLSGLRPSVVCSGVAVNRLRSLKMFSNTCIYLVH